MKLKQYLTEASSGIPKTFRVVIDIEYSLDRGVASQLKQRKLKGMKGISDSAEIIFQWLGAGRDSMLLMKGQDVIKNNKITKIRYGDPEFMLANNMHYLRRVWNKSDSDDKGTMFNIGEYIFRGILKDFKKYEFDIKGNAPYQAMSYESKHVTIDNIDDLIKWWNDTIDKLSKEGRNTWFFNEMKEHITNDKLRKYIQDSFDDLERIYSDESEWAVDDNTLNIPKGSYLYILTTNIPKNVLDDFNKGKETIQTSMTYRYALEKYYKMRNAVKDNKLDKVYKIKWVDSAEWERVKKIHIKKRYN